MEEINISLDNSAADSRETHSTPLLFVPTCENCNQTKALAKNLQAKTWRNLLRYHRELAMFRMKEARSSSTDNTDCANDLGNVHDAEVDDTADQPSDSDECSTRTLICRNCEKIKVHAQGIQDVLLKKCEQVFHEVMGLRMQRLTPSAMRIAPVQKEMQDLENRLQRLMSSVTQVSTNHSDNTSQRSFQELEAAVDHLDNAFQQLLYEPEATPDLVHPRHDAVSLSANSNAGMPTNEALEEGLHLSESVGSLSDPNANNLDASLDELSDTRLDEQLDSMMNELPISDLYDLLHYTSFNAYENSYRADPSHRRMSSGQFLIREGDVRHQVSLGDASGSFENPSTAALFVTRRPDNISAAPPPAAFLGATSSIPRYENFPPFRTFSTYPPPGHLGNRPQFSPYRAVPGPRWYSGPATGNDDVPEPMYVGQFVPVAELAADEPSIPDLLCGSPLPREDALAEYFVLDLAVSQGHTSDDGSDEVADGWVLI